MDRSSNSDSPEPILDIQGPRFIDAHGRTRILRGINLGAGAKLPSRPDGATHLSERFFAHRDVSFVGRPLALDDADDHLARLQSWGFNHLRLLVTWEAVEHAGPGIYDAAFLDYLEALVGRTMAHGMTLHVDPHQDVWSRFAGGDGAPGWTLEAVGIDPARVHETGAAILHQQTGDPFPRMIWPTNATRLAAATMFTLFFAGDLFAPRVRVEGRPVQDYLQERYCGAMAQVAARLRKYPNVLGYETMNEPSHGFVAHRNLGRLEGLIRMGDSPTPFQSMLLGAGVPQEVPVYDVRLTGFAMVGRHTLNPGGARLWQDGADCVWRQHGVWDLGADGRPRLLRPDYFTAVSGRRIDFSQDCYLPFANRYARRIRAAHPDAVIFLQTEIGLKPPRWGRDDAERIAFSPHWYDSLTLVMKRYHALVGYDTLRNRVVLGRGAVRRSICRQMHGLRRQAHEFLADAPLLLGETGIPFDLRNRRARNAGDYRAQRSAVDRVMSAIESTLTSACWWNYATDNDKLHGDQWNGEDFSIYSSDPRNLPPGSVAGGRALDVLVRPYARAIAGEPLTQRFSPRSGKYTFTFRHDPRLAEPTEIYVPATQYPRGCEVTVSDGSCLVDPGKQLVVYRHSAARSVHAISIRRR